MNYKDIIQLKAMKRGMQRKRLSESEYETVKSIEREGVLPHYSKKETALSPTKLGRRVFTVSPA
jgi:hypothetical protein